MSKYSISKKTKAEYTLYISLSKNRKYEKYLKKYNV